MCAGRAARPGYRKSPIEEGIAHFYGHINLRSTHGEGRGVVTHLLLSWLSLATRHSLPLTSWLCRHFLVPRFCVLQILLTPDLRFSSKAGLSIFFLWPPTRWKMPGRHPPLLLFIFIAESLDGRLFDLILEFSQRKFLILDVNQGLRAHEMISDTEWTAFQLNSAIFIKHI